MKIFLVLSIALLFGYNGNKSRQAKNIDPTGTYSLVGKTETKNGDTYGYFGEIQIKKIGEDKAAISFFVNKGAPSYNMGGFVDTLTFANNKATYKGLDNTTDCKIEFTFSENGITVVEDEGSVCGFGHGVSANGFFEKTSSTEPILEDPFTGKRIESKNSIYSENTRENTSAKTDVFNMLFDIKLVGLELQQKSPVNTYGISFSTACMCEGLSILMRRDAKKIYVFPYCQSQPSTGEYNNWEYNITSIDFSGNKMAVKGICQNKNSDHEELVFIFGTLDNESVFSLETEGEKPNTMWFDKYITHKEKLFEFDCGNYQG